MIVFDDRDVADKAAAAQHFGGGSSGGAGADNYNLTQRGRDLHARICRCERIALDLLTDDDLVATTFDMPAGDGIECRRAKRLAVVQTETRVVPGTSHRVADELSLHEWPAVMRTCRADRKILVLHPRDQDGLVVRMSQQFLAVREDASVNARREVRTGELCLPFDRRHELSPPTNRRRIGATRGGDHTLSPSSRRVV